MLGAGGLKVLAALGFSVAMIAVDLDGGLFGFKLGLLAAMVFGVPMAMVGAFDLIAGLGTLRERAWGYAMGLVSAVLGGLGFGVAGVLAIAIHTTGSLGKLFSEVNENADHGPIEGLRATGAGWLQSMGFGVVPQVLPVFLSYTLLRFEINVRGAAIVGFVVAGGIGQRLGERGDRGGLG